MNAQKFPPRGYESKGNLASCCSAANYGVIQCKTCPPNALRKLTFCRTSVAQTYTLRTTRKFYDPMKGSSLEVSAFAMGLQSKSTSSEIWMISQRLKQLEAKLPNDFSPSALLHDNGYRIFLLNLDAYTKKPKFRYRLQHIGNSQDVAEILKSTNENHEIEKTKPSWQSSKRLEHCRWVKAWQI